METSNPTVLLADDDDQIRQLLRIMLDAAGYKVLLAADGHEALTLFAQHPGVSVAVIDLVMPNKEGIETIRAMREQSPRVPIIAMSGAFDGQFLPTARMLGADATLAKPINLRTLLEVLQRLCQSAR